MNGLTLERDHHNGHWNEEAGDFDHCVPMMVHAESEEEAEEIRDHLIEEFGGDSDGE